MTTKFYYTRESAEQAVAQIIKNLNIKNEFVEKSSTEVPNDRDLWDDEACEKLDTVSGETGCFRVYDDNNDQVACLSYWE